MFKMITEGPLLFKPADRNTEERVLLSLYVSKGEESGVYHFKLCGYMWKAGEAARWDTIKYQEVI